MRLRSICGSSAAGIGYACLERFCVGQTGLELVGLPDHNIAVDRTNAVLLLSQEKFEIEQAFANLPKHSPHLGFTGAAFGILSRSLSLLFFDPLQDVIGGSVP
ncbi:hypothetical protein PMI42_00381 [Bradyrhizobium sp. YR681]|nr:hypothetical protein PMI42_00381 [Bradyrhizobium sp. YR681]